MIKVNLASSSSMGVSPLGLSGGAEVLLTDDLVKKEALKRLVLLLVGPLAFYIYEGQNLPAKLAELNAKNQQLSAIQSYNAQQADSVAEINKFKEDERLIEARISALNKISKERNNEIRVLDLLQKVIPEKAWLTRVEIKLENLRVGEKSKDVTRLEIQGLAMSDIEVSSFLDALTKSVFLRDVSLESSSEVPSENERLKRFEISCSLENLDE